MVRRTDPVTGYPWVPMELLANPETWIALITLTVLEIVLGIDNVIFISVLVQRLPVEQRDRARLIGLTLALPLLRRLLRVIRRRSRRPRRSRPRPDAAPGRDS